MRYLGMDVAKAKLDCLLLSEDGDKGKSKLVANSRPGIADFLVWIGKQHISPAELHVIMEGTGVYHEQAALALADAGVTVSIVNPAQVKDFGRGLAVRTKTDGMARRDAIVQDLQRERNLQEKADATDTPALIRQSLSASIEFLSRQLAQLQQDIDRHIDRHPGLKDDLALLQSILASGASGRKQHACGYA